jgi:hypothetical protein
MTDNEYYYRDQMRELQNVNAFVRVNTLRRVLNKLEWIKENDGSLEHAIEFIKCELGNK